MDDKYTLDNFWESACKFNDVSGEASKVSLPDLLNQARLVDEETTELYDALKEIDYVEMLDAGVDIMYVTIGLLQKLQNKGVDVLGAMKATAINNDSKFIESNPNSSQILYETVKQYKDEGVEVSLAYNPKYSCYVVKDSANKVRKPAGYQRNNLHQYVPKSLGGSKDD